MADPPASERRYYGWVVAWTAFGVLSLTYGAQFSFGVLLPSIVADLGVSRTRVSLAFSLYVVVYSGLSGYSGALTDRRGPRIVLVAGAVLLGAGYALTALSPSVWPLTLALGLVAGAGMSAAFVPCNATVVRWFVERRGLALSISTSGSSFAAVLMPLVAGWLVGRVSWRTVYVALAIVVFVGLLVASRLMVASPEARGLDITAERSGRRAGPDAEPPVAADEPSLTRAEAMRTGVFWVIALIFLCTWTVVFLPLVHLSPFARGLGVSAGVASGLVSAIGVGGLVGRTLTGGVSDRLGRVPTLGVVLVVQMLAFVAFALAHHLVVLFPAAIAFGFGYGGTTTVFPALVADRFGRAHAGAIVGIVFAGAGSVAAVGPFMAAWIYDRTGSYRTAFWLSALVNLAGAALVGRLWFADRRQRLTAASAGSAYSGRQINRSGNHGSARL